MGDSMCQPIDRIQSIHMTVWEMTSYACGELTDRNVSNNNNKVRKYIRNKGSRRKEKHIRRKKLDEMKGKRGQGSAKRLNHWTDMGRSSVCEGKTNVRVSAEEKRTWFVYDCWLSNKEAFQEFVAECAPGTGKFRASKTVQKKTSSSQCSCNLYHAWKAKCQACEILSLGRVSTARKAGPPSSWMRKYSAPLSIIPLFWQ